MKKLVSCNLLVGLLFSLFGCSNSETDSGAVHTSAVWFSGNIESIENMYCEVLSDILSDEKFADDEGLNMIYEFMSDSPTYDVSVLKEMEDWDVLFYEPNEDYAAAFIPSFLVNSSNENDIIGICSPPVSYEAKDPSNVNACIAAICWVDYEKATSLREQALEAFNDGYDSCYGNVKFRIIPDEGGNLYNILFSYVSDVSKADNDELIEIK